MRFAGCCYSPRIAQVFTLRWVDEHFSGYVMVAVGGGMVVQAPGELSTSFQSFATRPAFVHATAEQVFPSLYVLLTHFTSKSTIEDQLASHDMMLKKTQYSQPHAALQKIGYDTSSCVTSKHTRWFRRGPPRNGNSRAN